MKKSYIYILIIVLMITLVVINQKKDNKSFVVDRVRYFTSLDGNSVDSFPSKGNYEVEVNCTNAKGSWNYSKWIARINNITGKVSCNISFTSKTPSSISDYIKGLAGTEQGTGQVVNENGYRYEGKNPNNYIYFNDELWRIIGIFDSSSHGKTGEYLTKIIRNDSLGGHAWDKSGKSDWATSSLYNLLNTNYYNATDGTNEGNCYFYSTTITGNCNYTETGLQSEYRNMVENVTWYLGGKDIIRHTAEEFYTGERDSTSVCNGNTASITGYIGLMYVSDYGYSVLSSSCARTTNLDSYNTNDCGGSTWLYKDTSVWTITHSNSGCDYGDLFVINFDSQISSMIAYYGFVTRPVLYLKSNVQVYAGDGSISKPYQIKLAS